MTVISLLRPNCCASRKRRSALAYFPTDFLFYFLGPSVRYHDGCITRDIIIQNSQMKREIVCTIRRWASPAHREKMGGKKRKLARENRGNNIIAGYQAEMDISLSLYSNRRPVIWWASRFLVKIIDQLSGLYSHLIRPWDPPRRTPKIILRSTQFPRERYKRGQYVATT